MISDELCTRIQEFEAREITLRAIVATQEPLTYDSEEDGCACCFDSNTAEMNELQYLVEKLDRWRSALALLELYERQPQAVKEDADAATVWFHLCRRFDWATNVERMEYSAVQLEIASLKAILSPNDDVRSFLCELTKKQNELLRDPAPYKFHRSNIMFLPAGFLETVGRLGLITSKGAVPHTLKKGRKE
jgi:hypothetical protein